MNGADFRPSFMRWVAWILGSLLLVSAALKLAHLPADRPNRSWDDAIILGQALLSIWLFSGFWVRRSLWVAAALFFCFASATLWMIAHAARDCGCFGAVSLSPKVTYWIDLAALSASIAALAHHRARTLLGAIIVGGLAFYSGVLGLAHHQNPSGKIVVGRSWPPPGVVDISADLSQDRWIVLIFSSDCARCESLTSDYARDASGWVAEGKRARLAILDAAPHESPSSLPAIPGVVRGALLQSALYRHSPILLLLDHGVVQAMEEGWTVADWSYPPFSSWVR